MDRRTLTANFKQAQDDLINLVAAGLEQQGVTSTAAAFEAQVRVRNFLLAMDGVPPQVLRSAKKDPNAANAPEEEATQA